MPGWREIGDFAVYERRPSIKGYSMYIKENDYSDLDRIKSIAENFEHDRLHMDPKVSKKTADDFKKWVVDHAMENKWPIMTAPLSLGFLIVRPEGPIANIELIGVHPDYREGNIGQTLVAHFLNWAHGKFELCRAGTMEANTAACRLYESAGFQKVDILRTFHD